MVLALCSADQASVLLVSDMLKSFSVFFNSSSIFFISSSTSSILSSSAVCVFVAAGVSVTPASTFCEIVFSSEAGLWDIF